MNEKQLEIIKYAQELFITKGYDGTSIRDIAKVADVNIAMISYYFGSKEKLLETVFKLNLDNFLVNMKANDFFKAGYSAFDSLQEIIFYYVRNMNLNSGLYQILAAEGQIKHQILICPEFVEVKKYNLDIIRKVIDKGINEKLFRYTDPILIHATIMGTFMNFQMNQFFLKEELNLKSTEAFNQYIENNLSTHIHKTIKALLTYEE